MASGVPLVSFEFSNLANDTVNAQAVQGIQEDDQDTHHHARDLRRLRDARGAHRVRDGSSIFKCPEVG